MHFGLLVYPAGFASRSAGAPLALPAVAHMWGANAAGRPPAVIHSAYDNAELVPLGRPQAFGSVWS